MKNIKDQENLDQKKVLLRLDLNVPIKNGIITDQTRIDKILPIINFLIKKGSKILVMGLTFKENCTDTRNTKVKDLILLMKEKGIKVQLWDPMISAKDHINLNDCGIETLKNKPQNVKVAFVCVYHKKIFRPQELQTRIDYKSRLLLI